MDGVTKPTPREAPGSMPTKQCARARDDGKLTGRNTRRMEARIVYLERELAVAKEWIADLYDKLNAARQGGRA